jgi:hypothetical protein
MKGHLLTIIVLLLALACNVGGFSGAGTALFFVGAALEIMFWLRTVQAPRRAPASFLARTGARR